MDGFTIRAVLEQELTQCAALLREAFGTVAQELSLTQQNCPTNPAFITEERLTEEYHMGKEQFVLCKDDSLIGFAELTKKDDTTCELGRLAVLPKYRHMGGGKMLLDYAKEQAKKRGVKQITIGIIEENTRLKNWYEAHGFVHTGTKRFDHLPFTVGFMQITV